MVADQQLYWAGHQPRDFHDRSVGAASLLENRPTSSVTPSMHSPSIPHLIKYNITPVIGGVMLRIWEPAERDDIRVKPFLFMLKYRMASEAEAREFLTDYLSFYKSPLLQTSYGTRKTQPKAEG